MKELANNVDCCDQFEFLKGRISRGKRSEEDVVCANSTGPIHILGNIWACALSITTIKPAVMHQNTLRIASTWATNNSLGQISQYDKNLKRLR